MKLSIIIKKTEYNYIVDANGKEKTGFNLRTSCVNNRGEDISSQ